MYPWFHDAYVILNPDACMMHICMMQISIILDLDTCVWCTMYDALMHISTYLDPKPWCMNVWCIYLLPWSLTLKYVCMMHCIYLVCLFHGLRFLSYKFLEWTLFVLWPVMICKKCYDQWLWLYEHQWSYMIAMNTNHLWSVS